MIGAKGATQVEQERERGGRREVQRWETEVALRHLALCKYLYLVFYILIKKIIFITLAT